MLTNKNKYYETWKLADKKNKAKIVNLCRKINELEEELDKIEEEVIEVETNKKTQNILSRYNLNSYYYMDVSDETEFTICCHAIDACSHIRDDYYYDEDGNEVEECSPRHITKCCHDQDKCEHKQKKH
jgi:hypothetical protein